MVNRFEDIIARQKARLLTGEIYRVTKAGKFAADRGLATQAQRAAVSVMANIAEGFERNRATEFHQFLSIAKSSCAELRSHLYVALDAGYLDERSFQALFYQAEEVTRLVAGFRSSVERTLRKSAGTGPPSTKD
jgi:four helix bundle protein